MQRLEEEGRKLWDSLIPADAVAVIVAERIVDDSDILTDYHGEHSECCVILAASKSPRDNFREMRKAALLIPETAHLGPGRDEYHVMILAGPDTSATWRGRLQDGAGDDTWTTEDKARAVMDAALAADAADRERVPFEPFCPRLPFGGEIRQESVEHREKYSMGKGYYLQRRSGSGWRVSKTSFAEPIRSGLLRALALRHDHLEG